MTEERTKLEVIAPSVEEAIEKGLNDLGLTEDDVDVEILDEGKKGFLGLSARQARIALMIKNGGTEKPSPKPAKKPSEKPLKSEAEAVAGESPVDDAEEVAIARETINIILEKMKVNAEICEGPAGQWR